MNWDELPVSPEQVTVLALVAALIASAVLAPAFLLPSSPTQAGDVGPTETPAEGKTYEYTEQSPSRPDEIPKLHQVPDSYTKLSTDQYPAPDVRASAGSQTMQINVRTDDDGDPVLRLTDDRTHDGRFVAVPVSWFNETVGEVPEQAYIAHEDGSTYTEDIQVRGDEAVFYVREFSTNDVSFDGTFVLNATPAQDGDTFTYNVTQAGDNLEINVTGSESRHTETVSATGVSSGGTVSADIAGNADPPNTTLTFGGNQYTGNRYTPSGSGDGSLTVNGDAAPSGPNSGEPQITFTGTTAPAPYDLIQQEGDGTAEHSRAIAGQKSSLDPYAVSTEVGFTAPRSGNLTGIDVPIDSVTGSDYTFTVDVYMYEGAPNGSYTNETYLGSWDPQFSTGTQTININSAPITSGQDYTIVFETSGTNGNSNGNYVTIGTDDSASTHRLTVSAVSYKEYNETGGLTLKVPKPTEDPSVDVDGDGNAEASYTGTLKEGESVTKQLSGLPVGDTTVDTSVTAGGQPDWTITYDEELYTSDPSIDLDGDGTAEASYTGKLGPGQTADVTIDPSLSDDTWTVETAGGPINVTADITERTVTTNPTVIVNGNQTSYSGQLADGQTATLSTSDSWLVNGTNEVNVSVGDGSLSADAPTPQVGLDYSHEVSEQKSVDYVGEAWSERYTVSKTWEEDTNNATLTIPWASDRVVALRDVEVKYVDDSGTLQNTDTNPEYTFKNGKVVIQLGDINKGWKTKVTADGSKVKVRDGSISVVKPTDIGNDLNTTIEIKSAGTDFAVLVGGTEQGDHLHYVSNATFTADESVHIDADGSNALRLPNAAAGDQADLKTLPLAFNVKSGSVVYEIPDGRLNETQPVYRVEPGSSPGDSYDVTFTNASDGEDYILWNENDSVVIDQGTASSPLTLTDDDDSVRIIQFKLDSGTSSSDSDDGGSDDTRVIDTGGGGAGIFAANTGLLRDLVPLVGVGLLLGGLAVAARRDGLFGSAGDVASEATADATSRVPVVGDRLSEVLGRAVETVVSALEMVFTNGIVATAVGGAIFVAAIQSGIIAIPTESLVLVLVAATALGTLFILRELGEFSRPLWVGINVLATLVALESLSDRGVIAAVVESDVWPIVIIGGMYLAYRLLNLIRDSVDDNDRGGGGGGAGGSNTVTVRLEDGDD